MMDLSRLSGEGGSDSKKLDLESAKKVLRFVDTLEDDDDIQNVYHNLEMTDEIAEALG